MTNSNTPNPLEQSHGSVWFLIKAMLLTALAAGMGWGIRGQYGHETGAMIAGALASLTLVMLFIPKATSLSGARAAAMMTVGIGIGGTMTYGQTVGLTHDRELVGNWEALRWGLLGLFIKGGIWISFGATFLGMGLGGKRYRPIEMLCIFLALVGLVHLGIWLINSPFDPANKILPSIYFSDSWYFEPDKTDMKPRPEVWGGLLVALFALVVYVALVRRDKLAWRMAIVGYIAGGLGFSGGQCVQAFHAWNVEMFTNGALSSYKFFSYFNWWNMMETTFGLIFGTVLALGLWLNRKHIAIEHADHDVSLSPTVETTLISLHLMLLLTSEFLRLPGWPGIVSQYVNLGFYMCVLPMIGIAGGRVWPYFLLLPVVVSPICGKQLRNLVYSAEPQYTVAVGWVLFAMIPLAVAMITAVHLLSEQKKYTAERFAALALLVNVWIFFGLNTTFFNFAWPWQEWTGRTPNQLIFGVCAIVLSIAAIARLSRPSQIASR
jgi:hypothetical protein